MNWFVNLRTRTKLTIGFASITLFVLVVGLAGFLALRHTSQAITEVSDNRLPSVLALNTINEAQTAINAAQRSILITGISDESIDASQREATTAFDRAAQAWKAYEPLPQTPKEVRTWQRFIPGWQEWKADNGDQGTP
jgi:methyl-accepting chemotaxis protein